MNSLRHLARFQVDAASEEAAQPVDRHQRYAALAPFIEAELSSPTALPEDLAEASRANWEACKAALGIP